MAGPVIIKLGHIAEWEIINSRPSLGDFSGVRKIFDTVYSIMSFPVGLQMWNIEYLNQAHDKSLIESDEAGRKWHGGLERRG